MGFILWSFKMSKIIYDLPNSEYHASPAISKSGLDKIALSPAHFKADQEQEIKSDSDILIFGSAFHDYILLPEIFQIKYAVLEKDFSGTTKKGKEILSKLRSANKVILKYEWMNTIEGMAKAISEHSKASILLQGGKPEVSIFWIDPDTGLECRCRPDYIHSTGIIVDLKSTLNASPKAFAKAVANYRYHVQDAFYSEGYRQATGFYPKGFVFVAVEKNPPYAVACYELDQEAKAHGRFLYEENLNTLLKAKTTNIWTAYSSDIETLNLPPWAYKI